MALKGNEIIVYWDGYPIAGTRANEITSGCETIEIASATSGSWREFITGRKSWSITVNWLLITLDPIMLLEVGNTYHLTIKRNNGASGSAWCDGDAILTQCKITATKGQLAQGTFTFQGTGSL